VQVKSGRRLALVAPTTSYKADPDEFPNCFVELRLQRREGTGGKWRDFRESQTSETTHTVWGSLDPIWQSSHKIYLETPLDAKRFEKRDFLNCRMVFKIFHQEMAVSADEKASSLGDITTSKQIAPPSEIGSSFVELGPLMHGFDHILGWYHIRDSENNRRGQLYISVVPRSATWIDPSDSIAYTQDFGADISEESESVIRNPKSSEHDASQDHKNKIFLEGSGDDTKEVGNTHSEDEEVGYTYSEDEESSNSELRKRLQQSIQSLESVTKRLSGIASIVRLRAEEKSEEEKQGKKDSAQKEEEQGDLNLTSDIKMESAQGDRVVVKDKRNSDTEPEESHNQQGNIGVAVDRRDKKAQNDNVPEKDNTSSVESEENRADFQKPKTTKHSKGKDSKMANAQDTTESSVQTEQLVRHMYTHSPKHKPNASPSKRNYENKRGINIRETKTRDFALHRSSELNVRHLETFTRRTPKKTSRATFHFTPAPRAHKEQNQYIGPNTVHLVMQGTTVSVTDTSGDQLPLQTKNENARIQHPSSSFSYSSSVVPTVEATGTPENKDMVPEEDETENKGKGSRIHGESSWKKENATIVPVEDVIVLSRPKQKNETVAISSDVKLGMYDSNMKVREPSRRQENLEMDSPKRMKDPLLRSRGQGTGSRLEKVDIQVEEHYDTLDSRFVAQMNEGSDSSMRVAKPRRKPLARNPRKIRWDKNFSVDEHNVSYLRRIAKIMKGDYATQSTVEPL